MPRGCWRYAPNAIKSRVRSVLAQVGLESKERYYPSQLSGGEKQRAALARAIVNKPVLLLADEPTGNLDHENGGGHYAPSEYDQ